MFAPTHSSRRCSSLLHSIGIVFSTPAFLCYYVRTLSTVRMTSTAFIIVPWLMACALYCLVVEAGQATPKSPSPQVEQKSSVLLTNAEQIHRLTREDSALGHRVIIRGVVTCILPDAQSIVIQDSTRGIYIDDIGPALGPAPRLGELLEIDGITQPGHFAPCVHGRRITRLGEGPLPPPVHPPWDQLINGSLDTQYVEIQGLVTGVHSNGITLLTHGGEINALLSGTNGDTGLTWTRYENSLIRLRGCLFAQWDGATHQVRVGEIRLIAPAVTIEEPAPLDLFAIPAKRAWELLLFDPRASSLQRVKVSGQILEEQAGEYYLIDGTNGLRFLPKQPADLQLGDLAEVVGFPNLTGPSPLLREAVARKIGRSHLPEPKKLVPEDLFLGENDSRLVQIEAELLNMSGSENPQTLELQAGLHRLVARLDGRNAFLKPIPPGSRLQLTGVFVGYGGNVTARRDVDSFELLVHSPANVKVLAQPPWWTLHRVLWVLSAVSLVLVLVMAWVITLRRRVNIQTEIIRHNVQRETILDERTRIAREFHDTLEQALVGIGMQLDAATNLLLVSNVPPEPMKILRMARSMIRHSHEEARRSVWNLRTWALEQSDLPTALSEMKSQIKNGSPVQIGLEISGTPCQLPSRIEGHLLRIGQEATANAVRHAQGKIIRLELRYESESVQLSIHDDGVGFDAANFTSSEAGHFGLLGMRERAEKIGGTITLLSAPGSGTRIKVTVPLSADRVQSHSSAYPNG